MTTKERKLPWTLDELRAGMKEFERDIRYFQARREELLEKYPEQWVAVYRLELKGHARNLPGLIKQLRAKGVPRGEAYVKFLTKNPQRTVPG